MREKKVFKREGVREEREKVGKVEEKRRRREMSDWVITSIKLPSLR